MEQFQILNEHSIVLLAHVDLEETEKYRNEQKPEIVTTGDVRKTTDLIHKTERGTSFHARNSLQHCNYSTKEF